MNIIVCIKQVPDTTDIKIDPVTNTLVREGVESIINPFDLYAIEEAVRLKEQYGGTVTAVTMGPPQAEVALRDAVALGVDKIILLSDRKFAGADTWATSLTLAGAVKKIGEYDFILFGQQAIDGDTAQVGPGVAAHLDLPQICFVKKIESIDNNTAVLQRLMEDGYDKLETPLPAVLTVVKEINVPRLPSLRGKRNARNAELIVWNAADLELDEKTIGLNGSPTQVVKIFTPEMHKKGEKYEVSSEEAAEILYRRIKEIKA
ncbi:MAG: electron transfer flavoprotein subunit beta/FixA family protein [Candidatus Cloacimonadales bacterium]|jgi:electron transfer flavoprotein beta subunit|nr:electron transfer flavoprotein subunit beta/FixA family protein [Candidatus Cloacimonadota bacterium]MDD2650452.1 electron transfer flavoprotein subunit beta/FixA family protein [Candidatus Cloacimonadota bacterium]MDD3501433.1 electron transfer flavoprotein subunit beta/FixA family protein [Candidatus Cloacimonadota bacterium]MDX9976671.1 electron transfer flavoprotein subunit beta/FixA family protein [Candidatus Cloacimonadales bacterium]